MTQAPGVLTQQPKQPRQWWMGASGEMMCRSPSCPGKSCLKQSGSRSWITKRITPPPFYITAIQSPLYIIKIFSNLPPPSFQPDTKKNCIPAVLSIFYQRILALNSVPPNESCSRSGSSIAHCNDCFVSTFSSTRLEHWRRLGEC